MLKIKVLASRRISQHNKNLKFSIGYLKCKLSEFKMGLFSFRQLELELKWELMSASTSLG